MNNLEFALKYASNGYHIFPVYEVVEGVCACRNPDCASPGKHPRVSNGLLQATNKTEIITQWWTTWPTANIGMRTGAEFGIVVLDIDEKPGVSGLKSLLKLGYKIDDFNWVNRTGSGGYHVFFKTTDETLTNRQKMSEGLDLRASGGYVVMPPSLHVSGRAYEESWNRGPNEIPIHLMSLFKKLKGGGMSVVGSGIAAKFEKGSRDNALMAYAGMMRRGGATTEEILAALEVVNKNRCTVPKEPEDLERIARNASRYEPSNPITLEVADLHSFINRANLIVNLEDANDYMMVDLKNGDTLKIDIQNITEELGKEAASVFFANRKMRVLLEYNPRFQSVVYRNDLGISVFNTYHPPKWLRPKYFSNEELTPVDGLPDIYDRFFNHLVNNDIASKEYLIDWLARSLQGRNYTFLTAIGDQGIGKGILGTILQKLHGSSNFVKVRDSVFKERFNGPLKNRTLVYVDEIDLKSKESQDRIKDMSNSEIEIEEKGKDALTYVNHASFYLSSNSLDAVQIEPGDRRFSVIELTSTKLIDTDLVKLIPDLQSDTNISKLARYLYFKTLESKEVVEDRVFRSARYEMVREAGLTDWEEWVVKEWAPRNIGKEVMLIDLQDAITDSGLLRVAPGRRKLDSLVRKYPEVLSIRQDRVTMVRWVKILLMKSSK